MSSYPHSHFFCNTLYALDLYSASLGSKGKVYAAFGGTAFVSNTCEHGQGEYNNCACGEGFGNFVRILKSDGTYAFYAHLSEVYVEDGDMVTAGQCIGLEGASGAAGHQHLHFAVFTTNLFDDLTQWSTPGAIVPFVMRIRYADRARSELVTSVDIRWSEDRSQAPVMYGTVDYDFGVE